MLVALGVDELADDERNGILVCCRPPTPRALDPTHIAKAAIDLGLREDRVEVVESVLDAVGAALLATAEEARIVVTGSLYVVGAARSALVH